MKTILLRAFAAVLIACALTACPETHVGPDFGYKFVILKPADWDGVWQMSGEDNAVRFQVTDAPGGQITITDIPGPNDKKDKPGKPSILILHHASTDKDDKLFFATVHDQGDTSPELAPFLVHQSKNDSFVLWGVNNKAVEAAIKAGKLKGTAKPDKDGAHCRLDSDPANYALLVQPQFWEWLEPSVLKRQKK